VDVIFEHKLPLSGDPEENIPFLEDIVDDIISSNRIKRFYIGLTVDLNSVKSQHKCNAIVNLYNAKNSDDTRRVEFSIMKSFYKNQKNSNSESMTGEEIAYDKMNYVYLALWF